MIGKIGKDWEKKTYKLNDCLLRVAVNMEKTHKSI